MTISFYSGGVAGNTRSWLNNNSTQTAVSSATTVNSYTIPGNTLEADGDAIQISWTFTITGTPINMQIRNLLAGSLLVGNSYVAASGTFIAQNTILILRTSANTYALNASSLSYQVPTAPTVVITTTESTPLGSGTWADAQILLGEVNAYTAGTVTNNLWTVTLYTS